MISILVPLDGSKLAETVLSQVEDLARRLHAEVYFVQVVDSIPRIVVTSTTALARPVALLEERETEKAAEEYLSRVAADWQAKGIDACWEVVEGSPAASIVNFARSHKSSMIAMSTHGRSGLSRLVFGSVADQVMRDAGIPVLLVRPGQNLRQEDRQTAEREESLRPDQRSSTYEHDYFW